MKKFFQLLPSFFFLLLCLAMITVTILLSTTYSERVDDQADIIAANYAADASRHLRGSVDGYSDIVRGIVSTVSGSFESIDDFTGTIRHLKNDGNYSSLMFARYFKDGVEYTLGQDVFDQTIESPAVIECAKKNTVCCAGVVPDRQYSISAVAFTAPLSSPYADHIVLFFTINEVIGFPNPLSGSVVDDSILTATTSEEGEILAILSPDSMGLNIHNNIYEQLRGRINDKTTIDAMKNAVNDGISATFRVEIETVEHIICVSSLRENGSSPFVIIGIYEAGSLHDVGYSTINAIMGVLVVLAVLMFIMSIVMLVGRIVTNYKLKHLRDTGGNEFGAPSKDKFIETVKDILTRNKATAFALIVTDIKLYNSLYETLRKEGMDKLLGFIKDIYSKSLKIDEAYAYLKDGRFALLIHYREMKEIAFKLNTYQNLISGYASKLSSKNKVTLIGGIYQTLDSEEKDISKMIDMAAIAENANTYAYDFLSFRIFVPEMRSSVLAKENIEAKMDKALEDKNFQVFYQPMLNIQKNLPDGSEALVRWYDPESDVYMPPGLFMQVFEANRFIIKLDKYVYEQVCKTMREFKENGGDSFKVSVNVSSITAMEKDFISYYTSIKKKYNIADGLITLEFPESFSSQDFKGFREIVNQLHASGFRCCVDDFGSGNSSYHLLKEIPMDEIKLDRLFIRKGINDERDNKVFANVVSIAKDLGMKVTQKGVETQAEVAALKSLGCNTIQGYYYSKPLHISDFMEYIEQKKKSPLFF